MSNTDTTTNTGADAVSSGPSELLVPVTVLSPSIYALELQRRMIDELDAMLTGDDDGLGGFAPLTAAAAVARFRNAWELPAWGSGVDDVERATWVWGDIAGQERLREVILTLLQTKVAGPMTGAQIADAAVYDNPQSLPPTLKHLAMRCRRAQRRPMWTFDKPTGTYAMPPQAHDVFGAVIAADLKPKS